MKNWMGHKDNEVDKFWLPLEIGKLASCGKALWFLLWENTTVGFFNVWGTWHLSQHGASLWFAVRLQNWDKNVLFSLSCQTQQTDWSLKKKKKFPKLNSNPFIGTNFQICKTNQHCTFKMPHLPTLGLVGLD